MLFGPLYGILFHLHSVLSFYSGKTQFLSHMEMHHNLLSVSLEFTVKWMKSLSRVQLFATPCTVNHQAPLSMGFSRQEYWSGLPFTVDFFKAFFPHSENSITSLLIFKIHESIGFYWVFSLHLLHMLKCSLNIFPLIWWIGIEVAWTDFSGVEPCQYYDVKPTCFQWIFIYILKLSWYLIIAYLFIKESTLSYHVFVVFFVVVVCYFGHARGPWQWKHRVLTTGPPGNSLFGFYIRDFPNS